MASMAPPSSPEPPADLPGRDLPINMLRTGSTLVRIHRRQHDARFFGRTGDNRFDAPDAAYGVGYLALTHAGAFAETCLRASGARLVSRSFLAERAWAQFPVLRDLRLVALHGAGLARLGATAAVTSGDHAVARRWSAALHAHPAELDGIAYRANHDNGELCAALFERSGGSLGLHRSEGLLEDRIALAALLDRYGVGLG